MNNKTMLVALAIVIAAMGGAAVGYFANQSTSTAHNTLLEGSNEKQLLFYRNPMNPEVTSPVPAKDSMGMDYIPVYADENEGSSPAGTVRIDPVTVQTIGVRDRKSVV